MNWDPSLSKSWYKFPKLQGFLHSENYINILKGFLLGAIYVTLILN